MMRGEVVRFCYQKLDGSVRYAVGTLQSDAVKANIVGTGIPKRFLECLHILTYKKWSGEGLRKKELLES